MNEFAGLVVLVWVWVAVQRRLVGWKNLTGFGNLSGLLPEAKPKLDEQIWI